MSETLGSLRDLDGNALEAGLDNIKAWAIEHGGLWIESRAGRPFLEVHDWGIIT